MTDFTDVEILLEMRGVVFDDDMRERIDARTVQLAKKLSNRIVAYREPIPEFHGGKTDFYHLRVLQGYKEQGIPGMSRLVVGMIFLLTTGVLVVMSRLIFS